jgi:hypothetical protein
MSGRWLAGLAALGMLTVTPTMAGARGLGVEVWTDRGDDAVYQPGQTMEVEARASEDAYLLVYEIDAEGYVRLLYPYRGSSGFVEGRRTYPVPPERSNVELVVEGPVGQCYVVAIAAREQFRELPWYLRPYDMQAEQVGYEGMRDDEEGITAEGRIVGDPFVAMERIRRRVLDDAQDANTFGTSYATYYVHNEVRYPRYLCYDCHRPGRWAWWPGFDPYYSSCSVIDFRVNWSWGWGPGYWFGCVPYYNYVVRYDCPPRYRPYYQNHARFSSWDGWRRWNSMWGNQLVRYKSDPPAGYVAPSKFPGRGVGRGTRPIPPGFVASETRRGRDGLRPMIGRNVPNRPRATDPRDRANVWRRPGSSTGPPTVGRVPSREVRGDPESGRGSGRGFERRERGARPMPRVDEGPGYAPPRGERPREQRREARPPRVEKPGNRPADKPRDEKRSDPGRSSDAPRGGQRVRG